ncbi:MAG: hypothetical protein NTU63_00565 [Candidatus Pacearchaeota archaeon]|nr:hypothetical protein [Candidatus Pacearchaeota archaeon]
MRKPYLKKFSKISRFTVWIVDGKYIRANIDREFTNFGQHYMFNFIPKSEFWIDWQRVPGEEKFYIDSMLTINRLLAKGMNRKDAIKIADQKEKSERIKTYLIKERVEERKRIEEDISTVHIKLLKKYSKTIMVWIVDGKIIRDLFFIDFTEGGHDKVYPFIPKNEVWIDDDVNQREVKFILLHELHERRLMAKGMDYDSAHIKASELEYYCRCNPGKIDRKLKEEIKKNNGHK